MGRQFTLLDLYCGTGGAAHGYRLAGFRVVGVDVNPQGRYAGDEFHRGDALDFLRRHGGDFDAVHASPPCQLFSVAGDCHPGSKKKHPDLLTPTRALLHSRALVGKPHVIENVIGSPLRRDLVLCGSMFGLGAPCGRLRRHRVFELGYWELVDPNPPRCKHSGRALTVTGNTGGRSRRQGVSFGHVSDWRRAMQMDWATVKGLSQAIPPAYTRYVGGFLLKHLTSSVQSYPKL